MCKPTAQPVNSMTADPAPHAKWSSKLNRNSLRNYHLSITKCGYLCTSTQGSALSNQVEEE
jgi:hypothetical protein